MAEFGGFSSFPFDFGSEPSAEEKAWTGLRALVGEGGSNPRDAVDVVTIDGAWRFAKALALGALQSVDESALWQAFPHTATDSVPTFEEILGLFPGAADPIELRRQRATARYSKINSSDLPDLAAELLAIDERWKVVAPDHANARTTRPGWVYDPITSAAGTFDVAGRKHSNYPAFSDDHVVPCVFDIGDGTPPTGVLAPPFQAGVDLIGSTLPAWCDFAALTHVGFTLDLSLLDVTGFGS